MSEHAQLVLGLGITGLVALGAIGFLAWLAWSLFWDAFDHAMQLWIRRRQQLKRRWECRVGHAYYSPKFQTGGY